MHLDHHVRSHQSAPAKFITYLYETVFLTLVALKTEFRNKSDAESDDYLKLSSLQPDIPHLPFHLVSFTWLVIDSSLVCRLQLWWNVLRFKKLYCTRKKIPFVASPLAATMLQVQINKWLGGLQRFLTFEMLGQLILKFWNGCGTKFNIFWQYIWPPGGAVLARLLVQYSKYGNEEWLECETFI